MTRRRVDDVREATIGIGRGVLLGFVLVAVVRAVRLAWPTLSTLAWVHQDRWPVLAAAMAVVMAPFLLTTVGVTWLLAGTGSALRRLGSSVGVGAFLAVFFEYRSRTEPPPLLPSEFAPSPAGMWRIVAMGSGLAAMVVAVAVLLIVVLRDGGLVAGAPGSVR